MERTSVRSNAARTLLERLARKLRGVHRSRDTGVRRDALGGCVLVEWLWNGSDTPWARCRHALDTPRVEPGSCPVRVTVFVTRQFA
jgi:hypothetical protein